MQIGNLKLQNNFVMAPMAGISNPTYMKIISQMGCGLAFTELISSEAIVRGNGKTLEMLKGIDDIDMPVGVQIFGNNPVVMAKAAKIITEKFNIQIIDINMGCPVPKVAIKAKSGSALLKEPEKIRAIVKDVVEAVDVPVTVKIRLGWDENTINAVQVAKICEEAGASAITVHGRTRKQGYSGVADFEKIKEVVNSVSIPVIGNGDVDSMEVFQQRLAESGCAGIMVGRALMGNPWLVRECITGVHENVSIDERLDMMEKHLESLLLIKDEKNAICEMRSHLLCYLKSLPNNKPLKVSICKATTKDEVINILEEYRKNSRG